MNPTLELIRKNRDGVLSVAELLYGEGAWEIAKALTAEEKKNRTQARIGLTTNVVGIAAGAAGLGTALRHPALKREGRTVENAGPVTGKVVRRFTKLSPRAKAGLIAAGAGGAAALQAANLGGDFVANRVLSREANKKSKKIEKAARKTPEVLKGGGRLTMLNDSTYTRSTRRRRPVEEAVSKGADLTWRGEISKVDDDKRQVFGWASIVEVGGQPVVDLQGDLMDIDTIEKAAYNYVQKSRKGGNQHQKGFQASEMIESFIVTEEKKRQMGLPDEMPTGWWVGFQVHDEDTWQQVKRGERTEFSIHGSGVRKDVMV